MFNHFIDLYITNIGTIIMNIYFYKITRIAYPNVGPSCDRSKTCPGFRICLNLLKNLSPCPPPDFEFTKTTRGDPGRGLMTCQVLVSTKFGGINL